MPALFSGSLIVNKTALCAACTAALLSLAAGAQAADIYPVDRARFMTNARFDFKVELDQVVSRQDVRVEINGKDYRKVLSASEIWVPQEMDAPGSALIVRDVEIKKPGRYKVTVSSPSGTMAAEWDLYSTPAKAKAKNVILLLADGLSVGHRTAARILSKGVTNGMYGGPLAMDDMPHMALLGTSSVDTIAADSANTASAYMTGHKSSVNALGVYADRTKASQDDPRQETIAELLRRKTKKAIDVVSDAEIEDATPASVVAQTRRRERQLAKPGEHHVLSLAESMKSGLPAALVTAQACAHEHPGTPAGEALVVGWIECAAEIAGLDPEKEDYLAAGRRTLPLPRRTEGWLVHLADHDFVLSSPACRWSAEALCRLADEKYGIRDEAGQAAFRNYVLSNLTAMRLYGILFARGRSAFAAEVARLIKA